jgi:predicted aconitase with swiveling domain
MSRYRSAIEANESNQMNMKTNSILSGKIASQTWLRYCAAVLATALASCGGELVAPGEGGSGSVPPDRIFVSIGPVTNLTPLTVNGFPFDTAGTAIIIEDGDDDGKGLQLGMIARISARSSTTGSSVQVLAVNTGAELRGPVMAVDLKTQTFTSLGVVIEVDPATLFEGFAKKLDSLAAGDYVQVHGYPSGDDRIRATLVRKRSVSPVVKLTANVSRGACSQCQPTSDDFPLAGFAVKPQAGVRGPGTSIDPGKLVKVTGELSETPGVLIARAVDDYRVAAAPVDGSRVVIQGLFAGTPGGVEFTLSSLPVRVSPSTQVNDPSKFGVTLTPGNLLEVVGDIENGELKAIEVQRK